MRVFVLEDVAEDRAFKVEDVDVFELRGMKIWPRGVEATVTEAA